MFLMSTEMRNDRETDPHWKVEPAQPGDSAEIADVQRAGWVATYPDPAVGLSKEEIASIDFATPEKLAMWEESIEQQDDRKRIWVVRDNGKLIGYTVAEKRPDGHELCAIYVLPAYHGQGVGKILMNEASAWLGNESNISVWVFSHNTSAIQFYQKCGFAASGKTASLKVNGKDIPDLEMVKGATKN